MKTILNIKIPQVMTDDEALGSGPGCPSETTLLHPHRTGLCGAAIAFRQAPHLDIRIPQLRDDRFHVIRRTACPELLRA